MTQLYDVTWSDIHIKLFRTFVPVKVESADERVSFERVKAALSSMYPKEVARVHNVVFYVTVKE